MIGTIQGLLRLNHSPLWCRILNDFFVHFCKNGLFCLTAHAIRISVCISDYPFGFSYLRRFRLQNAVLSVFRIRFHPKVLVSAILLSQKIWLSAGYFNQLRGTDLLRVNASPLFRSGKEHCFLLSFLTLPCMYYSREPGYLIFVYRKTLKHLHVSSFLLPNVSTTQFHFWYQLLHKCNLWFHYCSACPVFLPESWTFAG